MKEDIDNYLLQAIEPEVKKALEKLKKRQALRLQDIMVLLLKSQFNHIQHIDKEQTILKNEFRKLKEDFNKLRLDFQELRNEFVVHKKDIDSKFTLFKEDITSRFAVFKEDITSQFTAFKEDITLQFTAFKEDITSQFTTFKEDIIGRFQTLETNIYRSQANLIKWLVAALIALGLIGKLIDKFL